MNIKSWKKKKTWHQDLPNFFYVKWKKSKNNNDDLRSVSQQWKVKKIHILWNFVISFFIFSTLFLNFTLKGFSFRFGGYYEGNFTLSTARALFDLLVPNAIYIWKSRLHLLEQAKTSGRPIRLRMFVFVLHIARTLSSGIGLFPLLIT